jgi:hypothetical protein
MIVDRYHIHETAAMMLPAPSLPELPGFAYGGGA